MRALKKSLYRLSGIICTVCQQNSPKALNVSPFRCNFERIYLTTKFYCPRISRIYTNFLVLFINGDLVGRTNHTNFRASERNQVLLELPSAAENVK